MKIIKKIKSWFKLYTAQFSVKKLLNKKADDDESVIVIKLDAIGDFIIWLDSAKNYRQIFPSKKIVLLCNENCKSIAEEFNYFDDIITLNISKFSSNKDYRQETIKRLNNMSFGTLVQASYSRTLYMDIIAAEIPAHNKIGFVSDESRSNLSRRLVSKKRKKLLDKIYDNLIMTSQNTVMEIVRNKEFVEKISGMNFNSSTPTLPTDSNPTEQDYAYFIVFPGASTRTKMWPIAKFAEIADYIIERTGWDAFVCGGHGEENLYQEIRDKAEHKDKILNYIGKTTLQELTGIIAKSKLVISNDTSGIHFAAATNTPAVCVFGEYNYGRFLPYSTENSIKICSANMKCRNCASNKMPLKCVIHVLTKGRYLCLDKITVEMVKDEIEGLLINDK